MNFNLAFVLSAFGRQDGILENFRGIGTLLTGIAISLGVGAIVLGSFQGMAYNDNQVLGELHTPMEDDGIQVSDGVTVTVNNVKQGLEERSETWVWYDASADSNSTLTEGENYEVMSYQSGEFNLTSVPDYNQSDGDELYVDYTYHTENTETGILGDGLGLLQDTIGFMEIAVVMLFGIIFMRYME